MSFVFLGTSLRSRVTILMASKRISMTLLMRASRGARGNAATNMVVKLNWITEERAKKKNIIWQKQSSICLVSLVFVVKAFIRAHTHLQKLMEQAEGVDIVETVVAEPVPKLAVIAQFGSMFGLWFVFQVAVGTSPLELLGPSSLQPSAEPADAEQETETQLEWRGLHRAHAITNLICTYGPVNSKTLLMVCLSTIMIAIWTNRSVRHPLGWHCTGESGMNGCMNDM